MKEENLRFYSMAAGVILALLVLLLCASSVASETLAMPTDWV